MKKQEIKNVLNYLKENYSTFGDVEGKYTFWSPTLINYEYEDVIGSINNLMQRKEFLTTPPTLMTIVAPLRKIEEKIEENNSASPSDIDEDIVDEENVDNAFQYINAYNPNYIIDGLKDYDKLYETKTYTGREVNSFRNDEKYITMFRRNDDEALDTYVLMLVNGKLFKHYDTIEYHTNKFKIFIAALTVLNIDDYNRISTTDTRLIRRIVRDKRTRGTSAEGTLSMWQSVRNGEFKWIYPYQEGCNYVYNSGLTYELCVLKKYALPALQEIPSDSQYYIMANRLIKFLKYFKTIDDTWIPCNSLLREFIGGSCFKDA